jgi:hypothetical protein
MPASTLSPKGEAGMLRSRYATKERRMPSSVSTMTVFPLPKPDETAPAGLAWNLWSV